MSRTDPEHRTGPPPPRPPGTIRLGRIAGADVLVSASWFLVAGLIALVVAVPFGEAQSDIGAWKYAAGLAFAVVLYGSILLHEVSHAAMAKHYGYPVTAITLHFLGGMTAIEGESRTPRQELMIAVVGPITSILVGGAALFATVFTGAGVLELMLYFLAGANLLIGLLNLIPGLPLDGGRVLKALVWGLTGNVHRGTVVAGWAGRVVAVIALAWPLYQERIVDRPPDVVDIALSVIVALFLWSGATAAMASAKLRRKLPQLVGRSLARRTLSVPEDLPVAEAVRRAREAGAGSIITVTTAGQPIGVVSEAAVQATPEERRPWVPVSSVSRTLEEGLRLPADIAGEDLILAISRRPADEYLLVEPDGAVFGVLTTADVDQAFRAVH